MKIRSFEPTELAIVPPILTGGVRVSDNALAAAPTVVPESLRKEFGPLGRRLARHYFEPVRFAPSAIDDLARLSAQGFVVHVMRTTAWVNFLYLHWALVRHGLPPLRAAVNLRRWFTRPFSCVALSGSVEERFATARANNGSALVFLRESAFNTARGRETRLDPFPALVAMAQQSPRPIFLVPELLLWEKWQQKVAPSVFDRLFGSPEAPGFLHSAVTFLRNFERAQLRVGEPLNLTQFVEAHAGDTPAAIARKVRSALHHHLARETRAVFGPPRKSTDRLIEEAMRDRVFQKVAIEVSQEKGRPLEAVHRDARRNFGSIAARYSPTVVAMMGPLLHWVFNRIYDGIEVDEAGLDRVMKAAADAPVVLTPSHKSHVDYLIMSFVLFQRGFTVPLVAAGANLSFFPLGGILRRAGAFFLRRSFKGDKLYTAVFRAYLKKLVHDGIHHEFFPEGGRSRTGKLLQPKLGLFTWLVDAVLEGARNDLLFVPVAIDYEKVVEGASYTAEMQGGEKKPEDLKALLAAPRVLTENYGRIHLRFDEPISLAQMIRDRGIDPATATDEQKKGLVRALGHRVMYGISRVSTVTPHALLASALLAHRRRGISAREVTFRIGLLRLIAADLKAPFSPQLANAPSSPTVLGPISEAMRMFASEASVRILETGGDTVYQVLDEKRPELSFFKNTLLNLVAGRTIVCCALLTASTGSVSTGTSSSAVKERAQFLSRLFKFEFLYPVGNTFEQLFDETLAHLESLGLVTRNADDVAVAQEAHVRPQVQFLADLIRDYLESYQLVARVAETMGQTPVDKKDFLGRCLEVGRADFLAGTLSANEALSKTILENALLFVIDQRYLVESDKKLVAGPNKASELVRTIRPFLPEVL
jgi:glycerol-3-phosphate O-acyltransferase